ncbi:hypothetical protein V3331_09090 [Gaopeijia maritima]|uniref:hypothetical protein n=1 Tax=Gaopeijia maritima TaxID=3119007 RepID=UPI0032505D93
MTTTPAIFLGLAVGLLLGCAEGANPDPAGAPSRATEAAADTLWSLSMAPEAEYGARGAGGPFFDRISGVTTTSAGTVAVVDGGGVLTLIAPSGEVRTFGDAGEGPGEFVSPTLLASRNTDSIPIYDFRLRRLHLVDPDDLGYRIVDGFPGGTPIGWVDGWAAIADRDLPRPRTPGMHPRTHEYSWFNAEDGSNTKFLEIVVARMFTNDPPNVSYVPFLNSRPVIALGTDGVLIAPDDGPDVRFFDRDGKVRQTWTSQVPPRPVDARLLRAAVADFEARTERDGSWFERALSEMTLPDDLPYFGQIIVEDDGTRWLKRFRAPGIGENDTWRVFSADGTLIGRVETPGRLEVQEVGADFILGVWVDELGVESVRRYTLRRTR